jgi:hypothetical protein
MEGSRGILIVAQSYFGAGSSLPLTHHKFMALNEIPEQDFIIDSMTLKEYQDDNPFQSLPVCSVRVCKCMSQPNDVCGDLLIWCLVRWW